MARIPLFKHHVGAERCEAWGQLKLCVIGRKYGFEGWLYSKGGKNRLPVPTGEARTARGALEHAKKFLRSVHARYN